MPKIVLEKIIRAERQHVFDIVANYENFQKIMPQYFTSVRIRSVRDNTAVVEEHLQLGSRELIMMTKHVTKYPETHEVFVVGGDGKGSHFVETFAKVPEGTKLTVHADIKLKGMLVIAGAFAKKRITSEFGKIIDEFARIAEQS
ncbi:SRPBCC family protein [Candidatus Nitrosotenuis cloacae]|uniref:SRPBCC family protein n=1 Tax=Candidatus Nitrosotenuis cloacae TaxID=1603555 RepID=UPI00227F32D3|nr:SRPBCC family protein [Candidatus Nitrosotenuis cloacae]